MLQPGPDRVHCVSRCAPSCPPASRTLRSSLRMIEQHTPFPATRFVPFEAFPSPAAVPHHCGRCLRAVVVPASVGFAPRCNPSDAFVTPTHASGHRERCRNPRPELHPESPFVPSCVGKQGGVHPSDRAETRPPSPMLLALFCLSSTGRRGTKHRTVAVDAPPNRWNGDREGGSASPPKWWRQRTMPRHREDASALSLGTEAGIPAGLRGAVPPGERTLRSRLHRGAAGCPRHRSTSEIRSEPSVAGFPDDDAAAASVPCDRFQSRCPAVNAPA
jgi:hypothetical protein